MEILAPAGTYEALVSGVNAGADAIYIGGGKFGARAAASNTDEDIIKGIHYAHHFGVKVYMTVNTLLKEEEMGELVEYLTPFYMAGIDAFIVQDLGVLKCIHTHFKNVEIHASTQMSLTGKEAVRELMKYGLTRVVPARETSLKEINEIYRETGIEIESFVHGALCYAYSGQCLMSSMIGGRSGNRGRCAQTCRLNYDLYEGFEKDKSTKKMNMEHEVTLLSCKDLCALDILPDMAEAGVYSLKIEGRMKSPRYTAGVVSIWRKYVDLYLTYGREGYYVEQEDRKLLLDLFNRGGQTEGYYKKHNGKDMMALEKKPAFRIANEEYNAYLDEAYVNHLKKIKLHASFYAKKKERLCLCLESERGERLETFGLIPEEALKKETTKEDIEDKLKKTGGTLYEFSKIDIYLDGGLFIPVKFINELRREALESFSRMLLEPFYKDREVILDEDDKNIIHSDNSLVSSRKFSDNLSNKNKKLHLLLETKEQVETVLEISKEYSEYIAEVSFEADTMDPAQWKYFIEAFNKADIDVNLYLPHIFREEARRFFKEYKIYIKEAGFSNFIYRNLEEMFYIKEHFSDLQIGAIADYTLYGMNQNAQDMLTEFGFKRQMLPLELNLKELRKIETRRKEVLTYGRIPMMVSAQCVRKNTVGCNHKSSTYSLKDRQNEMMPVKTRCTFCYNTIYNSKPLYTIGIENDIERLQAGIYRLWFTTEEERQCKDIIKEYIRALILHEKIEYPLLSDFTRGHFRRGIE